MRLPRPCWILAISMMLAGCAEDAMPKHVFPPRASIQQVTLQADGSWKLLVRMQNFSSVSMTFAKVDAKIEVAGSPAGEVTVTPALRIGPESADIAEASLQPSPAAAKAIAAHADNFRYKLSGRIVTSEPVGDYPYTFEGVLSPVPGLTSVLR